MTEIAVTEGAITPEDREKLVASRSGLLLVSLLVVAGCASASPATGSDSPSATLSPGGQQEECFRTSILGPDGNNVDLSGTWQMEGNGPIYYVSQEGVCVAMAGGFPPDQATADVVQSVFGAQTFIFLGEINTEFVVTGRAAEVRKSPMFVVGDSGVAPWAEEWEIAFRDGAAFELTSFRVSSQGLQPEESDTFTLTKLSDRYLEPLNP